MAAAAEALVELPIDRVIPSQLNPRGNTGDVAELAESIKSAGIIEPLIVVSNGKAGTHTVVAGHRRLAAAKVAGLATVPCVVREIADEGDLLSAMLIENLQRADLEPMQEARGFEQLRKLDFSTRQIATKIGKSQSHVMHRLNLLKLSSSWLKDYESGRLKLTTDDIQLLVQQPAEQQERLRKETFYGSVKERLRELKWKDDDKRRREAEAKRPKPEQTSIDDPVIDHFRAASARTDAAQKRQEKLRKEANAARDALLPRLLARGERELQYAALMLAGTANLVESKIACELLELDAKKDPHGYPHYSDTLAKRVTNKARAIEVLLALAIGLGEERSRGPYAGGGPLTKAHIERLQKLGYKPNARDRQLLRGRR